MIASFIDPARDVRQRHDVAGEVVTGIAAEFNHPRPDKVVAASNNVDARRERRRLNIAVPAPHRAVAVWLERLDDVAGLAPRAPVENGTVTGVAEFGAEVGSHGVVFTAGD